MIRKQVFQNIKTKHICLEYRTSSEQLIILFSVAFLGLLTTYKNSNDQQKLFKL